MNTVFRDFYPNIPFPSGVTADSLIREGIHDKYGIDHTPIPVSNFVAGTNTITLVQRRAVTATVSYVMYDYLSLELPMPISPPAINASSGDGKVTLNWTASPGAVGYYIRQSVTNGGPFKLVGTNVSSLSFTNQPLTNGQLYYYTVTATNASGASMASVQVSARPTSSAVPQMGWSVANGQFGLNWPADHTGWLLQMQTNSTATGMGTNWATVAGSDSTNGWWLPFNTANGSVFFRLVH